MPTKTSPSAKKTSKAKQSKSSPKSRAAKTTKAAKSAEEMEVTIDRRKEDRREDSTSPVKLERRTKVQRRRQIDPTTCERDYSEEEVSFMSALDEYKRKNGRMFPTCSEVLEVIRGLGYVKLSPAELALVRPESENTETVTEDPASDLEAEEELDVETL